MFKLIAFPLAPMLYAGIDELRGHVCRIVLFVDHAAFSWTKDAFDVVEDGELGNSADGDYDVDVVVVGEALADFGK